MKTQLKFKLATDSARNIRDAKVRVGWFEDSKYDDDTPIALVAFFQEYGTGRGIPQRPFMRPAEMKNKAKWEQIARQEIRKCIETNAPLTRAMAKLGLVVQGDIDREITSITQPPLAETTIKARLRRKGKKKATASIQKPLIDTGMMLASLTNKVEEK